MSKGVWFWTTDWFLVQAPNNKTHHIADFNFKTLYKIIIQ